MSMPKKYKHYFRFFDGIDWYYYTIDSSGNLFADINVTELKRAPDGWMEYVLGWERGFQYMGIFRSYALPMKLYKDAAKILRSLFYTYGIEAKCELLVEMRSDVDWSYSTLFKGDLDFTKFEDKYDHVVIPINEAGFTSKLKARESTMYEYPIEADPYVKYVKVPSINLQSTLNFVVPDSVQLQAFGAGIYPRFTYYGTEGTNLELTSYDVAPPSQSYFLRNRSAQTFNVDIKTKIRVKITTPGGNSNNGFFHLYRTLFNTNTAGVVTSSAGSVAIYSNATPHVPGTMVEYVIDQTDSFTIAPLQIVEYSFEMYLSGGGSSASDGFESTFTTGELKVYHVGATASQYVPALPAYRVYQLLIGSIGEDPLISVYSDILTVTNNNEDYITCGDAVRSLEGAVLKTCFRDFYEFFRSTSSASFWYDRTANSVNLEGMESVFDQTEVLDIGEAKECDIIPFTEQTFVNLKIGGPYKTLDDVNGKDAVNMTSEFLSPVTRLTAEKNMVSNYVTEMYDIVLTIQNLSNKETTDSDSDNDVMVLHANSTVDGTFTLEPSGTITDYYDVYKKAINLTAGASYWEIQNVFSPESLFNIKYTPARRVLNNGRYFRSLLWFNDSDYLKFQTSSKSKANDDKMITLEGVTPDVIDEGADIQISDLCPPDQLLFYPYLYRVVAKEEVDIYSVIESGPYKYIKFKWLGVTRTMFIMDGSIKPTMRSECTFKGLSTPLQSPTTLIR